MRRQTRFRRPFGPTARGWAALAVILGSVPVAHCGNLPEVVLEQMDVLSGTCETLYGTQCGLPCSTDRECESGLFCGPDLKCDAECGGRFMCADAEVCSEDGRCEMAGTSGAGGKPGGMGGTGSIVMTTGASGEGGAAGSPEECAAVLEEATEVKRPMDIIVAIDNSASMEGEIVAVQERINSEFADIIEGSEIDYRVIMVSRYGNVFVARDDGGNFLDSSYAICIGAPLGSLECPTDDMSTVPPVEHHPPRFFHHSTDIGSRNLWCRLLEAYSQSDPYPTPRDGWQAIADNGWQEFLREEAFKVFIAITDDAPSNAADAGCNDSDFTDDLAGAQAFDQALRMLAPNQFGALDPDDSDQDRNYAWYSIVGMAGNDVQEPTPLGPDEPVELECCQGDGAAVTCPESNNTPASDGVRSGVGYQELSRLTQALRYPSCYNDNFDDVFNAIAEGVIEGAKLNCEWEIPEPPQGEKFDKNKVNVEYQPGNGGSTQEILRVPTEADCSDSGGWFYDDEDQPTLVQTCPATCDLLKADPLGKIGVLFGCETKFEPVE